MNTRPSTHAAARVAEKRRAILEANPKPQRSELVDLLLAEARARQDAIDNTKPTKSSGLASAQRQPARQPVAKPAPPPTATLTDDEAAFFENLLAPAPPTDNTTDDHHDDN